MHEILLVSAVITGVFAASCGCYLLRPDTHRYVSRETVLIYLIGLFLLSAGFHMELNGFFRDIWQTELLFISVLFFGALAASYGLYKQDVLVCVEMFRTERCIRPQYVLVKSLEILVVQVSLLLLALFVSREMDTTAPAIILLAIIALLTQLPRLLHVKRLWKAALFIGLTFLAVVSYHTYIHLGVFWPAAYLHALLYVFVWMGLADLSDE